MISEKLLSDLINSGEKGPVKELKPLCRKMAAEGSVLLKNDNGLLPLKKKTKLAVFGRIQEYYYKSGTGSGGRVNTEKSCSLIEALEKNENIIIDKTLKNIYADWISKNPFETTTAWAKEPWSQKEMPIDEKIVLNAAKDNDAALILIGRSSGEDHDNSVKEGSYLLTKEEYDLIRKAGLAFKNTIVVLNIGNIVDLSFLDDCNVTSLLTVWQGGEMGALAVADLLTGKESPSGKLPDTIVKDIMDYPASADFDETDESVYYEDIFVGYRYFETFKKDSVRYPFGFGLSYTDFDINFRCDLVSRTANITAEVKNTGKSNGREVVQIYCKKPCLELSNPARELVAYKKTKLLSPGESEVLNIKIDLNSLCSYDDGGVTGHKSCYVLLPGVYEIFGGTDIRSAEKILEFKNDELKELIKLSEVSAPVKPFNRLTAEFSDGSYKEVYKPAPLKTTDTLKIISDNRPKDLEINGDKGIKLIDVKTNKNSLDEFVSQLSKDTMRRFIVGEGMNSPKVTDGTGAAFGGLDFELASLGIPACCVTDGPSGLRIEDGSKATLIPNGTLFASSFDDELTEEIFTLLGAEAYRYNIDGLLGPGLNIHRDPLNGRNFEYFSEDPYLSGKMAAAMTRGMRKTGVSTVIKHMFCNNRETNRHHLNAVVSERAIREIYLKGFEIAIKESEVTSIMTSYNPVNGIHSSSNYDVLTTVLRKEWNFKGMVMTDWWALCGSKENENVTDLKSMVRAGNDIYMVAPSSDLKKSNVLSGLEEGYITLGELQRNVKNILEFIMNTPTFEKAAKNNFKIPDTLKPVNESDYKEVFEKTEIKNAARLNGTFGGKYPVIFKIKYSSSASHVAQDTVSLSIAGKNSLMVRSVSGTDKKTKTLTFTLTCERSNHIFALRFPETVTLKSLKCFEHK